MAKHIGIVGYGAFGKLMHKYLSGYFKILVYDKNDGIGAFDTLDAVCKKSDILIFSVTMDGLEEAMSEAKNFVKSDTIVCDVSSVKVEPTKLMQKYFPDNQILATHPVFGPQSTKENGGLKGQKIVLSNISVQEDKYLKIKSFLQDELRLKVIEKSPEEHDKEMAHIQGLAHFIGRALKNIDIDDLEANTESYRQLVKLKELLEHDSWELFKTIQNNNPYAKEARLNFLRALYDLEKRLENDKLINYKKLRRCSRRR